MPYKEILLTQNKVALVDDEDYDYLMQWKWQHSSGYARRTVHIGMFNGMRQTKRIYMHRLILNVPIGQYTDHINGNKLDNRRCNLRICTNQQNCCNSKKPRGKTSSKYKGVSWLRNYAKWESYIRLDKKVNLGYFDNEDEAAKAYNRAAKDAWGKFARLNEIAS